MAAEADEDPKETKGICIKRMRGLLGYVTTCLATFGLSTGIPRDLVTRTDDTLTAVFGDSSKEIQRYKEYADLWNSFDATKRKEWLENLRYDLLSAVDRLESTPPHRFPKLGLGSIHNETDACTSIGRRLGVIGGSTAFSIRVSELCRRAQVNVQHKSPDAAAYLLRKVLEVTLIERFRKDKRMESITMNGRIIGLEGLIGKASQSAGGNLHPNVIKDLKKEKLLMDTSVHSLEFDPSRQDLDRLTSLVGVALAGLRISEL